MEKLALSKLCCHRGRVDAIKKNNCGRVRSEFSSKDIDIIIWNSIYKCLGEESAFDSGRNARIARE